MLKKLLVGAVGLGLASTAANAALTYNLYNHGTTDTSIVTSAGTVLTLDLVANLSGTNTTKMMTSSGALLSTAGALSAPATGALFSDSPAAPGTVQDLNGDGATDVGMPWSSGSSVTGWFYARSAAGVSGGPTAAYLLGQVTVTVDADGGTIRYAPRGTADGTPIGSSASWQIDGASKNYALDTWSSVAFNAIVPEPASLSLLALGGLSLLARRRA